MKQLRRSTSVAPRTSSASPRTSSASPPATSTTTPSEVPDPNTTLDTGSQLLNLGAAECSRRRCSNNGRCVEVDGETACVCSPAYRGDSCQDHILKTLQGPLTYGASGLCVAVVVVVVMAVVVRKRKRASAGLVSLSHT